MLQRQHMHGGADPDAFGAGGDLAGDVHRRTQYRAACLLVDFGEPEHVEPPAVGGLDLLKALFERVGVALAFDLPVKFVIPAELHGDTSTLTLPLCRLGPPAGIAQMPMFDPPHTDAAWRPPLV